MAAGFVAAPQPATASSTIVEFSAVESAASRRQVLAAAIAAGGIPSFSPVVAEAKEDIIATFKVQLNGDRGGEGEVKVKLRPDWAPHGVRRFKQLVSFGDLNNAAVYHVTESEAHFGLPANPTLEPSPIPDDVYGAANKRGTLVFKATGAFGSRCNQLFFNTVDNRKNDRIGLVPIGEVVEGMEYVDQLFSGDGERPNLKMIEAEGNKYLDTNFPKLSKILSVELPA